MDDHPRLPAWLPRRLWIAGALGLEGIGGFHPGRPGRVIYQFDHCADQISIRSLASSTASSSVSVYNFAIMDGAPQPVLLPLDRHDHLIEVPLIGKVTTRSPEWRGEFQAKFRCPFWTD
jgi:hypothetical protein